MAGLALARASAPWAGSAAAAAETVGAVWVNGIRMTVIPLIVSLLVTGIAAPGALGERGHGGGLGLRTVALLYGTLAAVALLVALAAPPLFELLRLDPAGAAALRASAGAAGGAQAVTPVPGFRDWLVGAVPTNPVAAAADGALLPLVVFTLAFACALARTAEPGRAHVVQFFRGVGDATLVLVGWVLALAPAGVFALAVVLGTRLGAGVVGALGFYLVVQIGLHAVVLLLLYPLAAVGGGVSVRRFARAAAPAQFVALSTRSSVAALPAMIDGARRGLGVPAAVAGFVLPLAVSVFRLSSPINWTVGALFVARLYGVELGAAQLALVAAASVALNATSPAVPSGGLLVQAPVYAAVGLPVEGLAILIALDMLPDLAKTTLNVTADMAAVAVLGRAADRGEATVPELKPADGPPAPPGVPAAAGPRRGPPGA